MSVTGNSSLNDAHTLEELIRADRRYPLDAYRFLHLGLEHAVKQVHGERRGCRIQHVSGPQLCEALRDLAVQQWGMLALAVLSRWGIQNTRDFGEMVFFLVNVGVWGAQETDRVEDFDDVFDLRECLQSYEITLRCGHQ